MEDGLTDFEKQQVLATLYLNRLYAPGLDRLAKRIAESITGAKEQESAMLQLSYYLAACGSFELAEEIARNRLKGYARASGLAAIASEIGNSDPDGAARYLQEAERLLSGVSDSDEQAILLQQISRGYAGLNNWPRAVELANRISPAEDKVATLCEIAGVLWNGRELGKAKRILEDAHKLVKGVQPSERTGALNEVAKVLVRMDLKSEAVQVWEEAISFASHSTEEGKWLLSICEALASLGHKKRAYEIASAIRNEARRTQVLTALEKVVG